MLKGKRNEQNFSHLGIFFFLIHEVLDKFMSASGTGALWHGSPHLEGLLGHC